MCVTYSSSVIITLILILLLLISFLHSHSTSFIQTSTSVQSRDSAVRIATGYGLDDEGVGVRVPMWARIFTSPFRPDRLWGPFRLLSNGYNGALSPGVKRPGSEADHSPPTSAEVKKMWVYTSTPTSVFIAQCLVKHRDKFTSILLPLFLLHPFTFGPS
jgi:hypothetical protein